MTHRFSSWLSDNPGEMFIDQFLYDDWYEHQDAFSPDFELMDWLTGIMADRMAWLPLPPGYSNLTVRVARFCPFGPCAVSRYSHTVDLTNNQGEDMKRKTVTQMTDIELDKLIARINSLGVALEIAKARIELMRDDNA